MKLFKEVEGQEALKEIKNELGRSVYIKKYKKIREFDMKRVTDNREYGITPDDYVNKKLAGVNSDNELFLEGFYDKLFPYDKEFGNDYLYINLKASVIYQVHENPTTCNLQLLGAIEDSISQFNKELIMMGIYENGLEVGFAFEKQYKESILSSLTFVFSRYSKDFNILMTEYYKDLTYRTFENAKLTWEDIVSDYYNNDEIYQILQLSRHLLKHSSVKTIHIRNSDEIYKWISIPADNNKNSIYTLVVIEERGFRDASHKVKSLLNDLVSKDHGSNRKILIEDLYKLENK